MAKLKHETNQMNGNNCHIHVEDYYNERYSYNLN